MVRRTSVAGLLVVAGFLTANTARAGWWPWCKTDCCLNCPCPYSPWNLLTPEWCRLDRAHHGPALGQYPPERFPGVLPRYRVMGFACRAVAPAALYGPPVVLPPEKPQPDKADEPRTPGRAYRP